MDYKEFLQNKRFVLESSGFDIDKSELNPMLYEFQKDIVRWALKKGKACIFADCGLGKTPMQLSWAYQVHKHTVGKILILAPLAVADQTKREAEKFGYVAKVVEKQEDCIDGINITNYEKLDRFIAKEFIGIVLDESSILKSYSGKVRTAIIQNFHEVPYKLACTATPAPNDYMELGNHSEFCGVMTRAEMLSMFFVHDGGQTSKWRLKGHAEDVFWQWLATFSVFVDNPNNIGYEIDGYNLPHINIREIIVDGDTPVTETLTLTERRQARKDSLELRCEQAAEIVNNSIAIAMYNKKRTKDVSVLCAKAADELLTISDVTASFVLGHSHDKICISGRSIGDINVQVILEKLGGGGHITLAGAQVEGKTIEEVKEELIIRINEYFSEIEN